VVPFGVSHRNRLADVYARHAPEGIRLAYLLTGDRALAEDLVQEAFLRFVGRLHFVRNPDAFEGYLRRTIVNLSKNHFRHRAVERSYLARHAGQVVEGRADPDVPTYETIRAALLALPVPARGDRPPLLRGPARRADRGDPRLPSGHRPLAHRARHRSAPSDPGGVDVNSDDDVRRFLDRMAAEPGYGSVDPAPVLARAYRRLARTTSVLGLAGVTLVAAIVMLGPNLLQASPAPASAVPAAAVATTPQVARITCLGHGRSHLDSTTVAVQSDGLHVAIIQDHPGRRGQVFIRRSGWMVSVGFSDPDHTRFRTVPSVGARVHHVAIGCIDPSIVGSSTPREFHRLTLVHP
jgi:hypothetical protein